MRPSGSGSLPVAVRIGRRAIKRLLGHSLMTGRITGRRRPSLHECMTWRLLGTGRRRPSRHECMTWRLLGTRAPPALEGVRRGVQDPGGPDQTERIHTKYTPAYVYIILGMTPYLFRVNFL